MNSLRRDRSRTRRVTRRAGRRARTTGLVATLERFADDGATLCDCADGRRCVA